MIGRSGMKMLALAVGAVVLGLAPMTAVALPVGPAFTLTTASAATFASTALGSTSSAQVISLTTTRAVTITSAAIAASVNTHQEFVLGAQSCTHDGSASTASGTACTFSVTFAPFYAGVHKAALTVTDSTGLVYSVGLTGFGDGPQTLLTPTSIELTGGASPGPFYAGDGGAVLSARFGFPEGVYIDASNNIYMADYSTNNVRVVYAAGAALACLIEIEEPTLFGLTAGTTSCAGATSAPVVGDVYTLAGDTTAYVTTSSTHKTGSDNAVLATETTATTSTLFSPSGVAVDSAGNVVVVNYGSFLVRVIYSGGDSMACLIEVENPTLFGLAAGATSCAGATSAPIPGYIYTVGGSGTAGIAGDGGKATAAQSANLYAVALSSAGDIFFADDSVSASRTARIRVIYNGGAQAAALIAAENPGTTPVFGNVYKVAGGTQASTGDGGLATSGGLIYSKGLVVDADGDVIFTDYNNGTVSGIANEGKVRVIYNGGATMAALIKLENPSVTAVEGNLYTLAGGAITTPGAGNGGLASSATFTQPYGVTVNAAGDIFVADYTDHTIRKIESSNGFIYAYAGTSGAASSTAVGNALTTGRFWDPFGVAVGESGTQIIGDYGIYRLKTVDVSTAPITFATAVPPGNTGTPTWVYHSNFGTQPATIKSVVASTNFAVVSPDSTSLYSLDCTVITTLAPGQTCAVGAALAPTASAGGTTVTGTLTITDTSENLTASTHVVNLTGTSGFQTAVALQTSGTPVDLGTNVTFTATVSVAAGQTVPTGTDVLSGTVTFTDGTTVIGSGPVTIDPVTFMASVSTTTLTAGSHTITATFAPPTGSTTYSSAKQSLTEVVVAPAFSVVADFGGLSVTTGSSVPAPFTITVVGGYTGTITATCSNLPANLSCTTTPRGGAVITGDSTQMFTVYLVSSSALSSNGMARGGVALAGLLGVPMLLLLARRRKLGAVLAAVLMLAALAGVSGCGNGTTKNPAVGTYGVNVTFSDGTTSTTFPVTVSVTGTTWQQ